MVFKTLFTLLAHSSYVLHKIIYVYHLIHSLKYFSHSYAEGMEGKKSSSSNQSSLSSFRVKQWVSWKNKFVLKETQANNFVFPLSAHKIRNTGISIPVSHTGVQILSVQWCLYFAFESVNCTYGFP